MISIMPQTLLLPSFEDVLHFLGPWTPLLDLNLPDPCWKPQTRLTSDSTTSRVKRGCQSEFGVTNISLC